MTPARRHALVAMLGMAGTAVGAAVVGRPEHVVNVIGQGLDLDTMFSARFADWSVDPHVIPLLPDPAVQKSVEEAYAQTLARTYVNSQGYRVMLSVAYGGRQNRAMNTHRPEVCYPAQGLSVRKSTWGDHIGLGERSLPVRRLVTGTGARNEPITYWLVVGRDITEFGLDHSWVTIKYGLTGQIPDGMLVRVSSVDDDEPRAFAAQDAFVRDMLAHLRPQDRQRILGVLYR